MSPETFVSMYGVVKYDATTMGSKGAASLFLGRDLGNGGVAFKAFPKRSHVSARSVTACIKG